MAAIDDLINQIEDEVLRDRIRTELKRANKQKKFGLVFEQHLPEATPLYDLPIKRGATVAKRGQAIKDLYYVESVKDGTVYCIHKTTKERENFPVDSLVTVAEFGEPIYPYIQPLDSICNAPDSDLWHTLIEADNYHALQLLEYLYAGKVDCIYIDPPYNTGARDWKYNNDYVDDTDNYRHSKWLSMMEKRLRLAKKLLNPNDSSLIITIDEKEYLHLGCLLEELFPEARMQMVSITINPHGAVRKDLFARSDEYAFLLIFGNAHVVQPKGQGEETEVRWWYLRRSDFASRRGTIKGGVAQFYPIYVDNNTKRIIKIGAPLPFDQPRESVEKIEGATAVFPIRDDGTEMNWGVTGESLKRMINQNIIRISEGTKYQPYVFRYLSENYTQKIKSGRWAIRGTREDGSLIVVETGGKLTRVNTVWREKEYDAGAYGSALLRDVLGETRFSFPKSLYSETDTIRFFVAEKPNALILDFFAGSGTTLHAVNLLNAEDGGHRRCILVTNNEVSADEAKVLAEKGYHPGDPEWDKYGIARYVTWPRTTCSIKGVDINGSPLKGNYLGGDPDNPRPMADGFPANAVFFKLGFLDKTAVALGRQFKQLLPLLWMKAGAHGPCPSIDDDAPPDMMILPENQLAILADEAQYESFAEQVNKERKIKTIFIITDSEPGYRDMIRGLKARDTFQLYRDYLDNFRINQGGRKA